MEFFSCSFKICAPAEFHSFRQGRHLTLSLYITTGLAESREYVGVAAYLLSSQWNQRAPWRFPWYKLRLITSLTWARVISC